MERLVDLENSISVAWRNNDRPTFRTDVDAALANEIPKALLIATSGTSSALSEVFTSLPKKLGGAKLQFLSPVFTILSVVTDILGVTLFSDSNQFAELYNYLEDQFRQVNAMIEANFHAIKDLKDTVQCGQASSQFDSLQTLVKGYFYRYQEMLTRAKTDRGEAMTIFDTELRQMQSSSVLNQLRQLLTDKSLYTQLLTHCARGNVVHYLKMVVELHQTFTQAIILDTTSKIRLYNLTKADLDSDRNYWRNQSSAIVTVMVDVGRDLVMKSWYDFYTDDVDSTLSSTAGTSASDAIGSVNNVLMAKYPYVRTAVMAAPSDSQSITITDAFGSRMSTVGPDSFICYRSHRSSGETVIVLCRNVLVYPNEQAELDSAYADYSRGVLPMGLTDAMDNDRWDDIGKIMTARQVSFFAVTVSVSLNSGRVSTVQSGSASHLVFFQSKDKAFRAMVIAKLVKGSNPSYSGRVVAPTRVTSTGVATTAQWTTAVALIVTVIKLW